MTDKNYFLERLNKRDEERIEKIQKLHKAKEEVISTDEQSDYLASVFKEKSSSIENSLAEVPTVPPKTLPDHFAQLKREVSDLQKYVASSTPFLKEFDLRKYLKTVQDLQTQCYDLEEKYVPRKKFGFSKRKESTIGVKLEAKESIDKADGRLESKLKIKEHFFGFESKENENLSICDEEVYHRDVSLRNLKNCTISLKGILGTLHISNLSGCVILCGPVNTSVFVTNCTDCKIAVMCQQLRMHTSKDIDVYLHVTSKGIIEDCTGIRTAPYTYEYDNIEEHIKCSTLDFKYNNWDRLDDFNWLSVDKTSPNWSVMEECHRIQDWCAV